MVGTLTCTLRRTFALQSVVNTLWSYVGLQVVTASCSSKPTLNDNTYTLSEDKALYATNETYEIYCIPGYTSSDANFIVCQSTGSWAPASPTCLASEGTYPWWLLLVAVLVVILVVACVLPRLLQCLIGKSKKKKDVERGDDRTDNNGYHDEDDDDDDERADSPVPDFGSHRHKKMTNMEFMTKLHKDVDKKGLKRATKNATF